MHLNALIRHNYLGESVNIPEHLQQFVTVAKLTDLIDFTKTKFDKAIKTTLEHRTEIISKYPIVVLGGEEGICNIKIGGTPSRTNAAYFTGTHLWVSIAEMNGQIITDTKEKITDEAIKNSNVKLIPKGTTLLSFKLSIGKTAIAGTDLYTNEAIAALIPKDKEKVLDRYLFFIFNGGLIDLKNVGNKAFGKSLNSTYLNNEVKIPLPPTDIQQQIIDECAKVDEEYNTSRMAIGDYRKKIAQVFENLQVIGGGKTLKINNLDVFEISIGRRILNSEVSPEFTIPVYSANVFEPFGMIDKLLITDFSKDSVIWGIDGDWMVNTIPANVPFYPTDHCGVLRIKTDDVLPKYMTYLLQKEGERVGFNRSYRASIDRIEGLTVDVAPIEEQRKAVAKVEQYEAEIRKAQTIMDGCAARKKVILDKYLN